MKNTYKNTYKKQYQKGIIHQHPTKDEMLEQKQSLSFHQLLLFAHRARSKTCYHLRILKVVIQRTSCHGIKDRKRIKMNFPGRFQ